MFSKGGHKKISPILMFGSNHRSDFASMMPDPAIHYLI